MKTRNTVLWVSIFSIAMGLLEAAVVVYLRRIYYPQGFNFPLAAMDSNIVNVEVWREAATIIMLAAIGMLVGCNRAQRFAWFLFSFAVWDIFYYVFLYVFLGWPQSLFTWDILFLIPVPWVGPIIAPVILALLMILYAMTIVYAPQRVIFKGRERLLMYTGCVVTIIAFTKNYLQQNGFVLLRNIKQRGLRTADLANYVPAHFDWFLFFLGVGLILGAYVSNVSSDGRMRAEARIPQ